MPGPGYRIVSYGLMTTVQVDDTEAPHPQSDPLPFMEPLTVGASVSDDARHSRQDFVADAFI